MAGSILARMSCRRIRTVLQFIEMIALIVSLNFCLCAKAAATNFVLSTFVEVPKEKLREVFPSFVSAFSDAHFQTTGFTSASGEWQFIRAESASICSGNVCPMILLHRGTDWKILVYAQKEITVSINYEQGESVQCDFKSNEGRNISLRYNLGEKIVVISQ